MSGFRRRRTGEQGCSLPPPAPPASLSVVPAKELLIRLISVFRQICVLPLAPRSAVHRQDGEEAVQVEIGSGTQAASRGPTWRIATPRY